MILHHKNRYLLLFGILLLALLISSCPERITEDEPYLDESEMYQFPETEIIVDKHGFKADDLKKLSYLTNKFVSDNQELTVAEKGDLSKLMFKAIYSKNLAIPDSLSNFYRVPGYQWPKITVVKTFSAVLFYVALIVGFISYFIGHNAGGKENKGQIFFAIGTATTVGILGRAVLILLKVKIFQLISGTGSFIDSMAIASTIETIFYILWTVFLTGISVYLYETFTVTAKEIYQGG